MKKEFKAPIVETKVLSAQDDIMVDVLGTSAETKVLGATFEDSAVASDFKQWKGFNK